MTDGPAGDPAARVQGRHVTSVQAWRSRIGGDGAGDADALDAVVIEFGVDGASVPPLVVPTSSIARLAAVLLDAAESETRSLPAAEAPAGRGPTGPAWDRLRAAPRHLAADVPDLDVPKAPGVYAWFCDGVPVHLGRAKSKRGLRARISGDHLPEEALVPDGSFRARVAAHLGCSVVVGDDGRPRVAPEDLGRLNAWIACCEVAWIACDAASQAIDLEAELLAEGAPDLPGG